MFFYFIKKRRRHIKFKLLARWCHFYASLVVASLLSGDVFLFSPKHTIETLGYFAVGGQINSWICIMELYNSSFNKDSGHFWGDVSLVLSWTYLEGWRRDIRKLHEVNMLVLMMMLTIIMMTETVVRLPGALLVEHSGGFLSVLYSSHAPEFSLLFLYNTPVYCLVHGGAPI